MERQELLQSARRLVIVVYPFQGHINPMLQLATILNSKGFSITIVHPQFNSPNPSNHPNFKFISIPDCLSESQGPPSDITATILALNKYCAAPFQQCMEKLLEVEDPNDRIACVIYDVLMYFAQTVADHLKLKGISVRTSAAATILAFAAFPRLHEQGYISFQELMSKNIGPELQFLKLKELLISMAENPTDAMLEVRAALTDALKRSSAFIVNTMHFLEQETLVMVQQHFAAPIFTAGPFHKLAPAISTSLLKEDRNCIAWLNKQAPKSVIYVSFGSLATMVENELFETAWGLANSEQPFLWVVRPGLVRGSEWIELLPEGFKEAVGERGCIVKWAPQKEVLAHGAVGGFWSHCGWNSTLESICEGVPMLCRPFFGDQGLNARYVCGVWKVGLELENKLERGNIERAIRRLMGDTEGKEMRQRAMDFKEKAEHCLREGGSSCNSLNELAESILKF